MEILKTITETPNLILVLQLDELGTILNIHHAKNNDTITWIAEKLESLSNIKQGFIISEESKTSYGKPEIFNFQGENEFHSYLPIISLTINRYEKDITLGIVKFVNYFAGLLHSIEQGPLFCVDNDEKITAFNSHFQRMIGSNVLGNPLSSLLSTTPVMASTQQFKDFKLPDFTSAFVLNKETIEWHASGIKNLYMELAETFDLSLNDIRVDIDLTTSDAGPPCLIIGEAPEAGHVHSDLEGYLLGPDKEASGLLFKKGGILQEHAKCYSNLLQNGLFSYIKVGNVFQVLRNNEKLFEYYDFNGLKRKESRAVLHLRGGQKCKFKSIALSFHKRATIEQPHNLFVSLKNISSTYLLLTRLSRFSLAQPAGEYTAYEIRDLSDIREMVDNLEEANRRLSTITGSQSGLLGKSKQMNLLREQAERIAPTSATVLIEGETGTGKEVLARFIHATSQKKDGPFIKVDCSTLPPPLFESLLFGHEKGAFTGADASRKGLLEQAQHGTLFLDEASNLTLEAQAKLLHFLQDKTITHVGGSTALVLDVRILVASNNPLNLLVSQGRFREDLYHRIAVVVLKLPTLKERQDDISILVDHFLAELNERYNRHVTGLSPEAFRSLFNHNWPGNVRELRNVIERSFLFSKSSQIREIVFYTSNTNKPVVTSKVHRKKRVDLVFLEKEPDRVMQTVKNTFGNMRAAADILNVSIRSLYYFLKKHGIKPNDLR